MTKCVIFSKAVAVKRGASGLQEAIAGVAFPFLDLTQTESYVATPLLAEQHVKPILHVCCCCCRHRCRLAAAVLSFRLRQNQSPRLLPLQISQTVYCAQALELFTGFVYSQGEWAIPSPKYIFTVVCKRQGTKAKRTGGGSVHTRRHKVWNEESKPSVVLDSFF